VKIRALADSLAAALDRVAALEEGLAASEARATTYFNEMHEHSRHVAVLERERDAWKRETKAAQDEWADGLTRMKRIVAALEAKEAATREALEAWKDAFASDPALAYVLAEYRDERATPHEREMIQHALGLIESVWDTRHVDDKSPVNRGKTRQASLAAGSDSPLWPWQAHYERIVELVTRQAEDEGLWFFARTAPEAYLQQELRVLHALIEAGLPAGSDSPLGTAELRADAVDGGVESAAGNRLGRAASPSAGSASMVSPATGAGVEADGEQAAGADVGGSCHPRTTAPDTREVCQRCGNEWREHDAAIGAVCPPKPRAGSDSPRDEKP
jgi:hypothetical protein